MENNYNPQVDLNFYPGFKRKALSFTIDDGNLTLDAKFISYVKPAKIKGTFNLVSNYINDSNRDNYYNLYSEYEIANHVKYHPLILKEGHGRAVSCEKFSPESSNPEYIYKSATEGLYYYLEGKKWLLGAETEVFLRYAEEGKAELEALFGKGRIKDLVLPYGRRENPRLFSLLQDAGYRSIRGVSYNGFSLPEDRMNWGFYASYINLLERAESFDSLEDDGSLKAFIFGVHSHDFENANAWHVLAEFCERYGKRENDFYYATVGEIFDVEDCIKAAAVTPHAVINNYHLPLYAKIRGKDVIIQPKEKYEY